MAILMVQLRSSSYIVALVLQFYKEFLENFPEVIEKLYKSVVGLPKTLAPPLIKNY